MAEENGVVLERGKLCKNVSVAFEWCARKPGWEERSVVMVKCDNAVNRGVAFPEHWRTVLRCGDLARLARKSAEQLRETLLMVANYAGYPRAVPLIGVVEKTIAEFEADASE